MPWMDRGAGFAPRINLRSFLGVFPLGVDVELGGSISLRSGTPLAYGLPVGFHGFSALPETTGSRDREAPARFCGKARVAAPVSVLAKPKRIAAPPDHCRRTR